VELLASRRFACLTFLLIAFTTAGSAQQQPNFTGQWTLESSTANGRVAVDPSQFVKHEGARLSVARTAGMANHSYTYTLDGEPHEARIGPSTSVSKATWEGQTLVIDRTVKLPTGTVRTSRQEWALDAFGKLVIKSTSELEAGKGPVTLTHVYVKK
jgi:hypothetical protein